MKFNKPILGTNPTEHEECVTLAQYLDFLQRTGKVLLYSHIPQETFTNSWGVKLRNKLEGVTIGVPDYLIVTAKNVLLFIEMKRVGGRNPRPEQQKWLDVLNGCTIPAACCKGFDEAKYFIDQYI